MSTAQALANEFITLPEIAKETGAKIHLVHSWIKYHRYMPYQHIFGKPVIKRSDYEKFKIEHPELIKTKAA